MSIPVSDWPERRRSSTAGGIGKHRSRLRLSTPGSPKMRPSRQSSAIVLSTYRHRKQAAVESNGSPAAGHCQPLPKRKACGTPTSRVMRTSTTVIPVHASERITAVFGRGSGGRSSSRKPSASSSSSPRCWTPRTGRACRDADGISSPWHQHHKKTTLSKTSRVHVLHRVSSKTPVRSPGVTNKPCLNHFYRPHIRLHRRHLHPRRPRLRPLRPRLACPLRPCT